MRALSNYKINPAEQKPQKNLCKGNHEKLSSNCFLSRKLLPTKENNLKVRKEVMPPN